MLSYTARDLGRSLVGSCNEAAQNEERLTFMVGGAYRFRPIVENFDVPKQRQIPPTSSLITQS
jgi:hypothetical protein